MLEQQPAIDVEMRFRLCANAPDAVQSVRAGSQGRRRFEAHITLCQMRIVSSDVGRVGNNNIETFILQRAEPVAVQQAHIAEVEPCLLYTSDAADDLLCVDL